jgi:hypothetical protein
VETWLFVILFLAERMQGGGKRVRERAELEMSGSGSFKEFQGMRNIKEKGRYLLVARTNLHTEKRPRTFIVCEIRERCE